MNNWLSENDNFIGRFVPDWFSKRDPTQNSFLLSSAKQNVKNTVYHKWNKVNEIVYYFCPWEVFKMYLVYISSSDSEHVQWPTFCLHFCL